MIAYNKEITLSILGAVMIFILCAASCVKQEGQPGEPRGLEKESMSSENVALADNTKNSPDDNLQSVTTETATFSMG